MCAVVGIVGTSPANVRLYDALTVLQHRGQDAAGIATAEGGQVYLKKNNGLVKDVFLAEHMRDLMGHMGIGHVRYPTADTLSSHEAQPLYVNSPYGITLSHNGNLTNAAPLKEHLFAQDRRHINTRSDSEILLNVFAHELSQQAPEILSPEHIFKAVTNLHRRCRGAYATVLMIQGFGLVAFRDPLGIRPLCFGRRETLEGQEFMVASESVALDTSGFSLEDDVQPGEVVIFEAQTGTLSRRQCADQISHHPCLFEFVYLARPDSIIDGISVYKSRLRMGNFLADKILTARPDHDIDTVIPVPDTSRSAAIQFSASTSAIPGQNAMRCDAMRCGAL